MMKDPALYTAGGIFTLVALAHLFRFFRADQVLIGAYEVPVALSLWAGLVILALAGWMLVAAKQ